MKARKIVLESCTGCPHLGGGQPGTPSRCFHDDTKPLLRAVEDTNVIPDWCPLQLDNEIGETQE